MTNKSVNEIIEKQQLFFNSYATLNIDFRIKQLKKLKQSIKSNEQELIDALFTDLGKCEFEAFSTEIGMVQAELTHHIKKLKKWASPHRVSTPIFAFPSSSYIHKQPYGRVLLDRSPKE